MEEIRNEVIVGAVVKHIVENEDEDIIAILFQKDEKNYKLFIPIPRKPHLIEQVDWT